MRIPISRLQFGLLLLLSVALIAAACGGGGDDAETTEQAQTGATEPGGVNPDTIDNPNTQRSDDGASVSVQNPDAPSDDAATDATQDDPVTADAVEPDQAPAEPPAGEGPKIRNGIEIISLEGTGEGDPAQDGDALGVRYRGTLDDGSEFDSNADGELLPVTLGGGGVIGGFDEALQGLRVGETIIVRIPATLAYGEVNEDLIFEFPREQTPPGMMLGQNVQLGAGQVATIVEITDEIVRIDANHELAGQSLTFEISIEALQ